MTRPSPRWARVFALLAATSFVLGSAVAGPPAAHAAGSGALGRLEKEFKAAIDRVSGATVTCVAAQAPPGYPGSSGVIVSRRGLVLSDGDAGYIPPTKKRPESWADEIEVRLPNLKKGGYASFKARVVRRDRDVDTSLLRIENPPSVGFQSYLRPGASDDLQVGAFTFAMGNAFNLSNEGSPSLTVGVVSHLEALPADDPGGRNAFIYTSAAINPGVNGGPLVDSAGRLIGTVSTWARAGNPRDPFQFLGKVIPIDRLRPVYADLPEAAEAFPDKEPRGKRAPEARALESVLYHTAAQSFGAVVSIEAKREKPVSPTVPGLSGTVDLSRYEGPFSGVLATADGYVVTSLYNLTNVVELLNPAVNAIWRNPKNEAAHFDTGLEAIDELKVYLAGGDGYPAELCGYHQGLGVAVIKADFSKPQGSTSAAPTVLAAAPAEALKAGVFALALGNPYGKRPRPDPLLTFGILSKQHVPDSENAWRGMWQTDAGVTDGNCGGAVVDIEGRLLGVLHLWSPSRHGRNSGIGFVVPWPEIEAALPRMMQGERIRMPLMGVRWAERVEQPQIGTVIADSAAAKAGLLAGDVITKLDGSPVTTVVECSRFLRTKWSGDTLKVTVRRGEKVYDIDLTLGSR